MKSTFIVCINLQSTVVTRTRIQLEDGRARGRSFNLLECRNCSDVVVGPQEIRRTQDDLSMRSTHGIICQAHFACCCATCNKHNQARTFDFNFFLAESTRRARRGAGAFSFRPESSCPIRSHSKQKEAKTREEGLIEFLVQRTKTQVRNPNARFGPP